MCPDGVVDLSAARCPEEAAQHVPTPPSPTAGRNSPRRHLHDYFHRLPVRSPHALTVARPHVGKAVPLSQFSLESFLSRAVSHLKRRKVYANAEDLLLLERLLASRTPVNPGLLLRQRPIH
jgi:hypothetical protein